MKNKPKQKTLFYTPVPEFNICAIDYMAAEEPLEKVGSILAIVLAAILISNEIIAWSSCKANTLLQYLFQPSCLPIREAPQQTPQSL